MGTGILSRQLAGQASAQFTPYQMW